MTGPDLCARLLEAIEQAESAVQKPTWKRGDLCPVCDAPTISYAVSIRCDEPKEEVAARPCGCVLAGEEQVRQFLKWQPNPDPAVSRRCAADREMVRWLAGGVEDAETRTMERVCREALKCLASGYGISLEQENP